MERKASPVAQSDTDDRRGWQGYKHFPVRELRKLGNKLGDGQEVDVPLPAAGDIFARKAGRPRNRGLTGRRNLGAIVVEACKFAAL